MTTKVPQNVLDSVWDSTSADWHQHDNGKGWVYKTANVDPTVYLHPTSIIYGNAQVSGNARVYDDARVYGNAWVSGDARVYGNAQVYANARVSGIVHGLSYLKRAAEAVKAEENPLTQSIKDHPLYAEITGQVHHIGGKP